MSHWFAQQNWNEYLKLLAGLIAIIRPFAVVPPFLGLTLHHTAAEKRQMASVTAFTMLVTLLVFTFFGQTILNPFAISLAVFRVAGGLIMLLLALDMLRSHNEGSATPQSASNRSVTSLAVVPLAIPRLAGPGPISTVIIYATLHSSLSHKLLVSGVIVLAVAIVFIVLQFAIRTGKPLGATTRLVFNHLMGLIIAAVAVEFIMDGLGAYFPSLTAA